MEFPPEIFLPDDPSMQAAKSLIELLFHPDPAKRLGARGGANEIKQHPFFVQNVQGALPPLNWVTQRNMAPRNAKRGFRPAHPFPCLSACATAPLPCFSFFFPCVLMGSNPPSPSPRSRSRSPRAQAKIAAKDETPPFIPDSSQVNAKSIADVGQIEFTGDEKKAAAAAASAAAAEEEEKKMEQAFAQWDCFDPESRELELVKALPRRSETEVVEGCCTIL